MSKNFYDTFIGRLQEFFNRNDYSAALEHVKDGYDDYPEQATILDFWLILLHARQGDPETSLSVFGTSIHNGRWFSELLLRRSPSLQALQGDPRFERLIALNQQVAEADRAGQFPYYVLRPEGRCKDDGPTCPTLIGLHSSGSTAASSMDFWKPAASIGWLTAAIQSSQALMKGVYVWDDRTISEEDLRQDYNSLIENYRVNPWQTVLSGHATSADIVLWLILSRKFDIQKFLIINPSGPGIQNLDEWSGILNEFQPFECRGYVLAGELDESIHFEATSELVAMLSRAGISIEMEVVNGVDGTYQPAYDGAIVRALNFLTR